MTKKKTRKPIAKRVQIDGEWYRLRPNGAPGVHLTHNDGWWTRSEFMAMIRSSLKEDTKYWKPKLRYKNERCRPYTGTNKTIKEEGQCEHCDKWFAKSALQVDHKDPCGSLNELDDMKDFTLRTFMETQDAWQLLCKPCHEIKTYAERYGVTEEQATIRKKEILDSKTKPKRVKLK